MSEHDDHAPARGAYGGGDGGTAVAELPPVAIQVTSEISIASQPPKKGEACTMVILGAGGDLTRRKLMPALFHLQCDGLLDPEFAILGVAREPLDDESFRRAMYEAVKASDEPNGAGKIDEDQWRQFAPRLGYVSGDLSDRRTYANLIGRLERVEQQREENDGRLFYLAIPPSIDSTVIRELSQSGVAPRVDTPEGRPWVRVIVEKPFGRSLDSARALNAVVERAFAEHQVYRIDHYLGKETVQNILVLRFANSIFEPVWNRSHVHHVQITAAETVGVEHRAGYYEEAGVVRDMFQNHLLQLLALTAMEPPVAFRADAVRDEKVKVLNAIRPIAPEEMHTYSVRGQYGPGTIDGERVVGYREEPRVNPQSQTPTYAALRLMIDNWRWQGVPFFLRSGKRMPRRVTEIAIRFRRPPTRMFSRGDGTLAPNVLAIRIQPDEGISLCFEIKVPGIGVRTTSAQMDFSYDRAFGGSKHSAYETLLLDAMVGDATLFTRRDGVEAAWRVVDPFIAAWESRPATHFPNYAAGTWGPEVANDFIARDGASWRTP
ncbi:MAG TPA: glucose-6-phosphate dehydrogenase [Gemmatimonadaceae bacterium]|nr:glucose-6-phosphate dehydrogenase [Gemmatimonadaceae bacterium]